MAEEHGSTVICSPHDTYTVARLINQSMPISYFMTRENIISFRTDEFTEDIRSVMAKYRFRDFPILNSRGKYVGMISRRNLLNADKKKIIMVDHNEIGQAVDGVENAEILEIIDHHRIRSIETMSPVYFRNQPLGCTATIVYQMYLEQGIEIPKQIAGLLCAAILSDTLMFRSPTCTVVDKMAAELLAKIAEIQIQEFATAMFLAGSNLKKKSPEEIFFNDYKKFEMQEKNIGIGQINSLDSEELGEIRERLTEYLDKAYKEQGVDIIYFMLTNILTESTQVIAVGAEASELIAEAFNVEVTDDSAVLPGVVSRKKQFVPLLMETLSQR